MSNVGRPPYEERARSKTFRLPASICTKLETYENQTKAVVKALKNYFQMEGRNQDWIITEIQKHEQMITQLQSLRRAEEIENEKAEKRFENEQYKQRLLNSLFVTYRAGDRSIKKPTSYDLNWLQARLNCMDVEGVSVSDFVDEYRKVDESQFLELIKAEKDEMKRRSDQIVSPF